MAPFPKPKAVARAALRFGVNRIPRHLLHGYYTKRYPQGPVPWSAEYDRYRTAFISSALRNAQLMSRFEQGGRLPVGYGQSLDERCVEYPWVVSRVANVARQILDAGSTLNNPVVLNYPGLANKAIDIVTLAPEEISVKRSGIRYLYADLRKLPIKTETYDTITCISTLEHIGMDNYLYSPSEAFREENPSDFVDAIAEMRRVLKSDGRLLLTVPFGAYQRFTGFQQFDANLLDAAIEKFDPAALNETIYVYSDAGWALGTREQAKGRKYVAWINEPRAPGSPLPMESDRAAAARSVACLVLTK